MKQLDDKHRKRLNNTKVDKIFVVTKNVTTKKVDNHYETLISEAGLYMMASCLGKTKECEEFRKFVFEDLLVSLRKAEQEMLEERVEYLEAQNAGLRAELNYWERKRKQARDCLTDNRKNPHAKENQDDWMFDYDNY